MRPGITINLMARDEAWSVWEAIQSTAPFADAIVVCDTGSTDGSLEMIQDAIDRLPAGVERLLLRRDLPDLQRWSAVDGRNNPHPGRDLGDVRNLLRDYSPTEWIWTVDADEVYQDGAAEKVASWAKSLPPRTDCGYLRIDWISDDPTRTAIRALPGTYPITGRIFRNRPGYCHRTGPDSAPIPPLRTQQEGAQFPGEAARYLLADGWSRVPVPGMPNCAVADSGVAAPIAHYEMATKPWRRKTLAKDPIPYPRPAVFDRRFARFGEDLYSKHGRR